MLQRLRGHSWQSLSHQRLEVVPVGTVPAEDGPQTRLTLAPAGPLRMELGCRATLPAQLSQVLRPDNEPAATTPPLPITQLVLVQGLRC